MGWNLNERLKKNSAIYSRPHQSPCQQLFPAGRFPRKSETFVAIAFFYKTTEKCYANQMDKYFSENNLYSPNQHGFRKGKSTVTALFHICESIILIFGKKGKTEHDSL